jgi:hypothetical protein
MPTKTEELLADLIKAAGPFRYARYAGEHESAIQAAATAALVVRPTTVAAITAWNGESPGGKSLIVDRIFTHNLVSTAVKTYYGLWYCVHKGMARPTADITTLRGTGDGVVGANTVVIDVGATVIDDGWFPCGREGSISETGVTPQSVAEWECMGRLVVPPGAGISVQVVASLVGDTFTSGLSWWRHQL